MDRFRAWVSLGTVTSLALIVGCGGASRGDDGVEESGQAMTASWFASHLPPGSAEEKAVLALVNDKSMSADEYVDTCSLSRAVSASIVDYRQGDEPADVSDDEVFDDISEVDRLPFTGVGFWVAAIDCAKAHYMPTSGGGTCATGTSTLQQTPIALEIVLDGSGSMSVDDKWTAATQALESLFDAQAAKNDTATGMGLLVFSDSHDATNGNGPYPTSADVGIGGVDATQAAALKGRLSSTSPSGGTPLYAAITGAYDYLASFSPTGSLANASKAVVVFTDGVPTDNQSAIVPYVQAHVAQAQLFAVGIGPTGTGMTGSYDPAFMGALAVAGGTRASATCNPAETTNEADMCHFQVTPNAKPASQIRDELLRALDKTRQNIAACDIGLQTLGTGTIDTSNVKVVAHDAATGTDTPIAHDQANGWWLDDLVNPTKVLLRGTACADLRATSSLTARVEIACK